MGEIEDPSPKKFLLIFILAIFSLFAQMLDSIKIVFIFHNYISIPQDIRVFKPCIIRQFIINI